MKKNIKLTVSALLIFSALLTSCSSNTEKLLQSTKDELEVVMTVEGIDVTMEMYRYVALNYKEDYENGASNEIWLGEEGSALLEQMNDSINKSLIKLYNTSALCAEYGINYDDEFISDSVDILMDEIYEAYEYDYESYVSDIASYYMNDDVYRFIMRNDVLAEELIQKMFEKGEILSSDEDIQKIFESDELIRVKQILIEYDSQKTDEVNLAYAESILDKVNSGEDFDTLIEIYGKDLHMFNNPDGYYITKGTYHSSFEEAAFSLEIGETSGIVETDAGYSIIKRYEKEDEYIEKNFDTLAEEYIKGQYNIILEEHEKTLTLTETDKLSDYSVFNLTMDTDK